MEITSALQNQIEVLLGEYWDLAFDEGKTGANHANDANDILHKIRVIIKQLTNSNVKIMMLGENAYIASKLLGTEIDGYIIDDIGFEQEKAVKDFFLFRDIHQDNMPVEYSEDPKSKTYGPPVKGRAGRLSGGNMRMLKSRNPFKNFLQGYYNAKEVVRQMKAGEWIPDNINATCECYKATRGGFSLWLANGGFFCEMTESTEYRVSNPPTYFGLFWRHYVWWRGARQIYKSANRDAEPGVPIFNPIPKDVLKDVFKLSKWNPSGD